MAHPYHTLIPQVVPFELSRIHLLTQIETHQHVKLIALIAPSGYGKTTLLAQYARALPGRTVWLTLSEQHADPTYFAEQLCQLLGLPHDLPPTGPDLAHALNLHHENTTLILDEADHLGKDAAKLLESFIRALGEGHLVCLAAHSEVQLKLSRLAAQGQAFILTTPDLAFQDKESHAYLLARGKSDSGHKLHHLVEGWPVGLSLIASSGSAHLNAQDYILDILDELPREVSRRLPELAVLDVWHEGSPTELGLTLPDDWLQHLRKQGLPMTPLGGAQYRLHSLLRQTLLEQLRSKPEVLRERHLQVARMSERATEHLKAIQHYLLAGNPTEARRLAEQIIPPYDVQGFELLVKHTLEQFAYGDLGEALQLILIENWLATGEVNRAEQALHDLHMAGCQHVRYPFTKLHLLMRKGQLQEVLEQSRTAAQQAVGVWNLKYRRVQAQAEFLLGRPQEALQLLHTTLHDARSQQELTEVAALLYLQSSCLLTLQHWSQAEQCLKETRDLCKKLHMTPRLLHVENTLAGLHLISGQYEQAHQVLSEAIPLARNTDAVMLDYLLTTQADWHMLLQDHARAREVYCEALQEAEARGRIQLYYQLKLHLAELQLNDNPQSLHLLTEVQTAAENHPLLQSQLHFIRSLTLEPQDALVELEQALKHPLTPLLTARIQLHLHHHQKALGLPNSMALEHILDMLPSPLPLQQDLQRFTATHATLPPEVHRCCTPTVHLTTLQSLRVQYQEKPLKFQYSKSAEILCWLVLQGASTRDQIITALWDGSSDPKHINYFKVAMRALRTAFTDAGLGLNPIPFDHNLYYLHPDIEVTVDVLTLIRHGRNAQWQNLLQLLPDKPLDFMPGVHSEWVLDMRDALTQDLVQYTLKAALRTEPTPERIQVLEQLPLLDPLQEDLYLQVLQALESSGDSEAAQRVYHRYARMLSVQFNSQPDPALRLRYATKA